MEILPEYGISPVFTNGYFTVWMTGLGPHIRKNWGVEKNVCQCQKGFGYVRRASSKRKSYRMRGEASVGLSTAGGEDGTLVPAIFAAMKGLSSPRESNSMVPASKVAMKGLISLRESNSEVAK
ncbi:hypothetical protein Ancab_036636 [Ancistrocladus abbreviatus]